MYFFSSENHGWILQILSLEKPWVAAVFPWLAASQYYFICAPWQPQGWPQYAVWGSGWNYQGIMAVPSTSVPNTGYSLSSQCIDLSNFYL